MFRSIASACLIAPPVSPQIYTWMDATLRELSDLIKEVKPAARGRMTRISFALVYPDKRGRNVMRQVSNVKGGGGGGGSEGRGRWDAGMPWLVQSEGRAACTGGAGRVHGGDKVRRRDRARGQGTAACVLHC